MKVSELVRLFLCLLTGFTIVIPAQSPTVPIVDLRIEGLPGGTKDGKWIDAGLAAESIANRGMDLFVFGFGGKEKKRIRTAKRAPVEDVCSDFFRIDTGLEHRLGLGIGANAKWNPMPRIPKRLTTQSAELKAAVIRFLRKQGIKRPVAKITQAFHIDLDNDGVNEILITATNIKSPVGFRWSAGEYSFSMLRKLNGKRADDYLLDGNFFKNDEASGQAPNRYQISSIADLNGDGKMEIVLYSEYYEGAAAGAFEMNGGKPELIKELQIGCGV